MDYRAGLPGGMIADNIMIAHPQVVQHNVRYFGKIKKSMMELNGHFFRNRKIRLMFCFVVAAGYIFGFMDLVFHNDYERLHIFLFNLAAGGFVVMYLTENRDFPGFHSAAFLLISIVYSISAYFHVYPASIACSLALFIIVESLRIRTFGFFPWIFFDAGGDVSRKFHQASVLCLSIALLLSSMVILNNEYFFWIYLEKLNLNVFFLGYSFPISLITMSAMFSFAAYPKRPFFILFAHLFFWTVNLGVVLFFVFILLQMFVLEVVAASILAAAVISIFPFYIRYSAGSQQKRFLLSGMTFLLFTGITGIAYLFLGTMPLYYPEYGRVLLRTHAYLSLYGWNLSGLIIIIRWNDFPLRINSKAVILFHWAVILSASISRIYEPAMALSMAGFLFLLSLLFSEKQGEKSRPLP